MKNHNFDNKMKQALQEQAKCCELPQDADARLRNALDSLQASEMEEKNMKRFTVKKAVIIAAAAVMVLGTISIASGKVAGIIASTSSNPDYTSYADLSTAEKKAGVTTNAPESFSNGYTFYGIHLSQESYLGEDNTVTDSFTSLMIDYRKGTDTIYYEIQPRPMLESAKANKECFEENGVTYYYHALRNKFVPVGYEPTEEEKAQIEAGTLNIGVTGTDSNPDSDIEPHYDETESQEIWWEVDGQQRSLFCMDNDISKEALISMALEIQ